MLPRNPYPWQKKIAKKPGVGAEFCLIKCTAWRVLSGNNERSVLRLVIPAT